MIGPNKPHTYIVKIKLKKNQFNTLLMSYIRACFRKRFVKVMENCYLPTDDELYITRVVDLEFEKICL